MARDDAFHVMDGAVPGMGEDTMRDGFIFYRSFYDSIELLPKKYKYTFVSALCEYALNGVLPESLPGGTMALFNALKPQIDANNRKYENGRKGGRPKANQTETKPKPNDNQTETKAKPKEKEKEKDKVKEKDKDKLQEKALGSSGGGSSYGDDPFNLWKRLKPSDVDMIFEVYPESGDYLIQEVHEEVRDKKKKVDHPVQYILGYAKKVGWDDKADHFVPPEGASW